MPDERPAEPKSFWATLPGLLTAVGATCGGIATLVTALYSAGVLGKREPEVKGATAPAPPAVSATQDRSAAELAEVRRKLDESIRAKQQAEEARSRADAEAARLRSEQAARSATASRSTSGTSAATSASQPAPSPGSARAPSTYEGAPTSDAIVSYRVLSADGEEMDVEVAFSYDPRVHGDRGIYAGVHLLYQGTIITGYKPSVAPWQRGKAVIRVVVRTPRGRQSDEIEAFLYASGQKPFLVRRFPFVKTFD